ncbi:MAG: NAD-dependent epimerase/dehydratase family protein [Pseudodesulfovibrio sp.]
MGETYLVTGGAGFIGSHVSKRLLEEGHRVFVADCLLTGSEDNLPKGVEFINIDLSDESQYQDMQGIKPTAVLHLAGQSSGEISFESPARDLDINTRATLLLAQWTLDAGCNRFLYASSVSVYGDGQYGVPMSETTPTSPKSFYSCSKLASEQSLRVFGQTYGLDWTAFRLFNVFGPGQNMDNMKQGMVSIYLSYVLFRDQLEIKGDFSRFRDFVHVSDVVDLLMSCLHDDRSREQVFNVGTGRKITVAELVKLVLEVCGKPDFPVKELPGTPGDAFGSLADISKVQKIMGWSPKMSLEEGLRQMVAFYAPSQGESCG